ncbi:MAG: ferredoxin [Candidatus Ornithospirochaeta sp.]|nr:ferredoxin [Candidatus Ornithospirochaeta sp.]
MKIDCTIDGKTLTLNLNSNKPLSLILQENIVTESANGICNGHMCGLCAVLMEGRAVLSCMVPAFEIRGKEIITFDSFRKTRDMKDIEKAYDLTGYHPCRRCYASRSIIIQSLMNQGLVDKNDIKRELSAVRCTCMTAEEAVDIVQRANEIRRRKNARKS